MADDTQYRPDIDGLRGIAVLSVLIFHCVPSLLPGGFIGVDVFFVISGYLICSILLKDIHRDRFSIRIFYSRRIRRIFPALITVLALTCAFGWWVLFPEEWANLGKHIVGGAGFISNLLLWKETGYFADAAEYKPLLHLWSLGIEEQFYMFFPLLLWFAARRRLPRAPLLLVILLGSLALSLYTTPRYPGSTFYLPITRLWELMIGCLLASIEQDAHPRLSLRGRVPAWTANTTSLLGTLLILGSACRLTRYDPFPGAWALLPTLGAALVIWVGNATWFNHRILGNRPLVAVGLISYPLYLWHWPLLYFARILSPVPMPHFVIAAVAVGSFALAFLTFWFVERPIRFGSLFGTRRVLVLSCAMAGLLVFGALANRRFIPSRLGMKPIGREVTAAMADWHYPSARDYQGNDDFKVDTTVSSNGTNDTILFVGDSHMQHYWPAVESILQASPETARPVEFLTASGSPTLPNVNRIKPGYAANRFFDFALREAAKPNITTVVFTCFWEKYFIGCFPAGEPEPLYHIEDRSKTPLLPGSPGARQVLNDFGQAIAQLRAMGKEVIVILSSPASLSWNPKSTPRLTPNLSPANPKPVPRTELEAFLAPIKQPLIEAVLAHGGKIIDPLDFFEENGGFVGTTSEGRFRYRDADHLRPFYVKEQAAFLDPLLRLRPRQQTNSTAAPVEPPPPAP